MPADFISLFDGEIEVYSFFPILGWNGPDRRFTMEEIAKFATLHLDRISHRNWDMMTIGDNGDRINISRQVFQSVEIWRDMLRQGVYPESVLALLDDHIEALQGLKGAKLPVDHWEQEMAMIVSQNFRNDVIKLISTAA